MDYFKRNHEIQTQISELYIPDVFQKDNFSKFKLVSNLDRSPTK